jgi:hypothetical protein
MTLKTLAHIKEIEERYYSDEDIHSIDHLTTLNMFTGGGGDGTTSGRVIEKLIFLDIDRV